MENQIYLLFNRLSGRYGSIFSFPTDAYASKAMNHYLNENKMSFDEYVLFRVGSYDIATGHVTVCTPESISWSVSTPVETEAN